MKRTLLLLCPMILVLLLAGCGGRLREESGYQVYYTDEGHTGLQTESFSCKETEIRPMLAEIFEHMRTPSQPVEHYSLFPESVEIMEFALTDGQLTVTFNEAYSQMDNVTEILLRAGLVGTVTQFGEVRTVVFHIGKDVLRDKAGEPVGAMTRAMFVNNPVGINSYQYASLTLYFANAAGDRVVKEMRNIHYSSNTALEKIVLEQLQKGPMNQQLRGVLGQDIKVQNITIDGKTCIVNLDQAFLQMNLQGIAPEVTIYAIVNSLCDVLKVERVQFQVDGDSNLTFGESLSLAGPFHRNADIIETPSEMENMDSDAGDRGILGEPSVGL
ncbi:MAG: GerMN domain-containing protein [Eubacteriales bacterium]|nr:GerMN domain-containing protein [Eubacteriales bacterium]